jgi:hypothetical protein
VLVAACVRPAPSPQSLGRRAAEALGARDGYVFVFSPFNCSLQQEQIDALNTIAARKRRSGIILTIGPGNLDDATSANAVAKLGLRMRSKVLMRSALRGLIERERMESPIVIALRSGRVIGTLSGESAERVDSWIEWLEGSGSAANNRGGLE